jgi:hypothetical protein
MVVGATVVAVGGNLEVAQEVFLAMPLGMPPGMPLEVSLAMLQEVFLAMPLEVFLDMPLAMLQEAALQ